MILQVLISHVKTWKFDHVPPLQIIWLLHETKNHTNWTSPSMFFFGGIFGWTFFPTENPRWAGFSKLLLVPAPFQKVAHHFLNPLPPATRPTRCGILVFKEAGETRRRLFPLATLQMMGSNPVHCWIHGCKSLCSYTSTYLQPGWVFVGFFSGVKNITFTTRQNAPYCSY